MLWPTFQPGEMFEQGPWEAPWMCPKGIFHQQQQFVVFGLGIAAVTLIAQALKPAPWGRFDNEPKEWGPRIPIRIGHVLNDGLHGVVVFLWMWSRQPETGFVNRVFVSLWLLHFVHRGFIHPFLMMYGKWDLPSGITVTGLTLSYFSVAHAIFFGNCRYTDDYLQDGRFLAGVGLFVCGTIINKTYDMKLRDLRANPPQQHRISGTKLPSKGDSKFHAAVYHIPRGGLFEYIVCPNYFGETMQWLGW